MMVSCNLFVFNLSTVLVISVVINLIKFNFPLNQSSRLPKSTPVVYVKYGGAGHAHISDGCPYDLVSWHEGVGWPGTRLN